MKKIISEILVTGLVVAMLLLSLTACSNKKEDDPAVNSSFVNLDINPNLDLIVDSDDNVIGVVANNEDAEILLVNTKLIGKSIDSAVDEIIKLSYSMGYIGQSNNDVRVAAISPSGAINKGLSNKIVQSMANAAKNVQSGENPGLEIIADIPNSVKRRCENFKQSIKNGDFDPAIKEAAMNLNYGKYMVMEKTVGLSKGAITMEKAVTTEIRDFNKSVYKLNSKCDVVTADLFKNIEDDAMDLISKHQGIIDNIYDQIEDLNVKHRLIFRKAFYKAQQALIDAFDEVDDVVNKHEQMFFKEPVNAVAQSELSKTVDKIANELFTVQSDKDAFKASLKNSDGKYSYFSVAAGLGKYLDKIADVSQDKAANIISQSLDSLEALILTAKSAVEQAIDLAYQTSKSAVNAALNAYISGVNIANNIVGLPEIQLPAVQFESFKEMHAYFVKVIEKQAADIEKSLTDLADKYLSDNQKSEISLHRKNVENAYQQAYENYKAKLQAKKDLLLSR